MRDKAWRDAVLARVEAEMDEHPSIEPYLTDLYADTPELCRAGRHPFAPGPCVGCAQLRSRRSYQARMAREAVG